MSRDDIIRMAREADPGFETDTFHAESLVGMEAIERFAALVAAAEREAIAQMIEDAPPLVEFSQNDKGGCMVCGFRPKVASAAIRARSES